MSAMKIGQLEADFDFKKPQPGLMVKGREKNNQCCLFSFSF